VVAGAIGLTGGPIAAAIGAVGGAIVGAAAERMMHSEDDHLPAAARREDETEVER
jgi:outer membrane lipoprotein SlyB